MKRLDEFRHWYIRSNVPQFECVLHENVRRPKDVWSRLLATSRRRRRQNTKRRVVYRKRWHFRAEHDIKESSKQRVIYVTSDFFCFFIILKTLKIISNRPNGGRNAAYIVSSIIRFTACKQLITFMRFISSTAYNSRINTSSRCIERNQSTISFCARNYGDSRLAHFRLPNRRRTYAEPLHWVVM